MVRHQTTDDLFGFPLVNFHGNSRPAQNPTHCPFGLKKGPLAFSVPGIATLSD